MRSWGSRAALGVAVLAVGLKLDPAAGAEGPSFDCATASAPIEQVICGDEELARADRAMADAYAALRQTLAEEDRESLLREQRLWLQSRFGDCAVPAVGELGEAEPAAIADCLVRLYAERTDRLRSRLTAGEAAGEAAATADAPRLRLAQTVFPATGEQQTILSVRQFGRYSLAAHSPQGTAIQIVSRMTGPGMVEGEAGASDGRIDQFLDRGDYKVVLTSSDKGGGEATLDARAFDELNGPEIPRLAEFKLLAAELDDYQQRSYWLEVTERRVVAIEAAGRNLADLRLWKDGNWLVDAAPEAVNLEPEAGKPYVLQHFKSVRRYSFEGTGRYWISTLHSGSGEDSVDATALLTSQPLAYSEDDREQVVRSTAPELTAATNWSRRFNLLAEVTIFFDVKEAGDYRLEGRGVDAEYRFEPFITRYLPNYEAPPFQRLGSAWTLEAGHFVLTLRPATKGKGILDLAVRGANGSAPDTAADGAAAWPDVRLEDRRLYTLYLNEQPEVQTGVILRALPIDLAAGLPLTLKAGAVLELPVVAAPGGMVTAVAEDGSAFSFTIDHGEPLKAWAAEAGEHVLRLQNGTGGPLNLALDYTPQERLPDTPLPPIAEAALQAIPRFPVLEARKPHHFDIVKDEQRTFALTVTTPALYRIETTGLLQTEGTVRTRTVVSLDRQARNGVGRNFLIQQYLGEGDYQATVAPQGHTQGHLGVQLTQTPVQEGGALKLGTPTRRTIAAGQGLSYGFAIAEAGRYRLRALGLNRTFTMRLEDAEGWPLLAPGVPATVEQDMKPGHYRMIILPQPVEARVVTVLERPPLPEQREGHGPHVLALNETVSHLWLEPEDGGERRPDMWRFTLPAPIRLVVTLSGGMQGKLMRLDQDGNSVAVAGLTGGVAWHDELPAGDYRVDVVSERPNNRFDYGIGLTTGDLAVGLSHEITAPADIPVSIGTDALVEIGSFGYRDVRAWLYDDADALVATNDDRANDWNFAIVGRLQAGRYRLHVDPVGAESAETAVSLKQPVDIVEADFPVGEDRALAGADAHLLPLTLSGTGDLLVIAATARGAAAGLTLEQRDGTEDWRDIAESVGASPWLAVPLPADGKAAYRLRTWLVDGNDGEIRVQSRRLSPKPATRMQFLSQDSDAGFMPIEGITPPLRVAAVAIDRPGTFRLRQPSDDLRWSSERGVALANDGSGIVYTDGATIWLADRIAIAADRPSVSAEPLTVDERGVKLMVPAGRPLTVVNDGPSESAVLWIAESRLGQPGIGLDGLPAPMAIAERSAITLIDRLPAAGAATKLWNAADDSLALPVTLRRFDFALPMAAPMAWGLHDGAIDGGQAQSYRLPAGNKRVRLVLPPGTAAELEGRGKTDEVVWAGARGLVITEDTVADRLLLFPTAAARQYFSVSLEHLAGADAMATLGDGRLFRQHFAAAGTVRLRLKLSAGAQRKETPVLRVVGAVERVTVVGEDGTVQKSDGPIAATDGIVDIDHGAGLVVAWVDRTEGTEWLSGRGRSVALDRAAVIPLKGNSELLRFAVKEPRFLHLKTTAPVIAAFASGNAPAEVRVFPGGADMSLYLPAGRTRLALQSAATGPLAGVAEITTTDVQNIGEGLGPTTRLAPGESRIFSFTLTDERDIGVGVRGSTDAARCRLLDATGSLLGEGVVQMRRLKPGRYLLAVDLPAAGEAVEVQPVLVGAETPDSGPPDEVKRRYLELAGLKPAMQE